MSTNLANKVENELLPNLTRETAKLLQSNQNKLSKIRWHSQESNTDEGYSNLAKKLCLKAYNKIKEDNNIDLSVEITDLKLTFKQKKTNEEYQTKIELKSSKTKSPIPGSTFRSLDINTWVIFCYRKNDKIFEIRYGRYHLGMNISTHETIQDRSPRPKLKFENFQKTNENPQTVKKVKSENWLDEYADAAINRVLDPQSHSWQDDFIKSLIKKVLKNPKKFKKI